MKAQRFVLLNLLAVFALLMVIAPRSAVHAAGAVRSNAGFNTTGLTGNDDGSTGLVDIGFTVNFYGTTSSQLYVNNNGNVTFDNSLSTFTPFDLNSTARRIIAPFFADIDTRVGNITRYGNDTVDGRPAFGVNWLNVGYFATRTDKLNSIQLVMVDRSDIALGDFDFEFNYDQIQWETGEASSGVNGLGGFSARVGYSNGAGISGELPGSAVNGAFLDGGPNALVSNSLNSSVSGRYLFQVRGGTVTEVMAPAPLRVCGANLTPNSVVGQLQYSTQAFYEPGKIAPGVFLNPGTYYVLGTDESLAFYKIVLACQYLWVPIETMGVNFDAVWQGRPLPTDIVSVDASNTILNK